MHERALMLKNPSIKTVKLIKILGLREKLENPASDRVKKFRNFIVQGISGGSNMNENIEYEMGRESGVRFCCILSC